ncbi:MAG: hypothetical protein RBU29_04745 [bacterium]|jgi:hypothetical protein|nr:hypothetical protein [bacterium]
MIAQGIQFASAWILLAVLFWENGSIAMVFGVALSCLLILYGSSLWLKRQNQSSLLLEWISLRRWRWVHLLIPVFLWIVVGCLPYCLPEPGIAFLFPEAADEAFVLQSQRFEITPPRMEPIVFHQETQQVRIQTYFFTPTPILCTQFYTSHGGSAWWIDGEEFARHAPQDSIRHLTIFKTIPPGFHLLEAEILYANRPFPTLSVSVSGKEALQLEVLQGPFSLQRPLFFYHGWTAYVQPILVLLFALSLLILLPVFNAMAGKLLQVGQKAPRFCTGFLLVLGILTAAGIHYPYLAQSLSQYEADEAAFGMMAQLMLEGQAPPLFHYGQRYQGTIEAYPLAGFLQWSGMPGQALRGLPTLYYILFMGSCVYLFWRYGSRGLGIFALFFFAIGGMHFHWIFTKAWFGYPFTLVCGTILWWIAFYCYRQRWIPPLLALLWGMVAGLSMYSLPLAAPFVLFSLLILVAVCFQEKKAILPFALALGSLCCFLFPYFASYAMDTGAVEFLAKGRELAAPRVAGESKFWDRFVGECLPVFVGVRFPFEQQSDTPRAIFPMIPVVLFLLSLVLYPLLTWKRAIEDMIFADWFLHSITYIFCLFCLLIVTYSPFGIWPWYAIPLYFGMPLVFYFAFLRLSFYSMGAGLLALGLYFVSVGSGLFPVTAYHFQPLSLSLAGLRTPANFSSLVEFLDARGINFLFAEQGFDYSPVEAGRDWVGETLTYESEFKKNALGRHLRRFPFKAQESIFSCQMAYLFHEEYLYNNPPVEGRENFAMLSIENVDVLFGESVLGFERFEFPPYRLYAPPPNAVIEDKAFWRLDSSNPFFMGAAVDHGISVRSYGRDAYWSSGPIPEGGFFAITFPEARVVQRIVVFHGTKWMDHADGCQVVVRDVGGKDWDVGTLMYVHDARASAIILPEAVRAAEVRFVIPPQQERWWTAYEIWIY